MTTRTIGLLFPESCLASHINMIRTMGVSLFEQQRCFRTSTDPYTCQPPTWTKHPILALQNALTPFSERDKAGFARSKWFVEEGTGYRLEQSTKPQTLGYSLSDSPVGVLSWIYEKLHDWTDDYQWTDDEILRWVSIYWFSTAGPTASLRIYYEAVHVSSGGVHRDRTNQYIPKVKLGLLHAPKELSVVPHIWGRTLGPTVYESQKLKGGHFAAWEIPDEVVGDLQKMFGKSGPCYQITKTKSKL